MRTAVPPSGLAWATVLAAAGIALLQVSPVVNPPRWDECIVLYDAWRTVSGEVPYRDFFNFLPPGPFLFYGLVFRILSAPAFGAARYVTVLLVLAAAGAAATALRRRGFGEREAVAVAFLLPLGLFPFWAVPSHHWLATLAWSLFLLALSEPPGRDVPRGRWAAAGLAAGAGGLFLQTDGLLLVLAGLFRLATEREGRGAKGAAFAGGAAFLPAAAVLGLAFRGGFGGLVRDALLWPWSHYSRPGNENYRALLEDLPGRLGLLGELALRDGGTGRWAALLAGGLLYGLLLLLAAGLLGGAVLFVARTLRRGRIENPWAPPAAAAILLAAGLFARGNPNWLHLVYALWPLLLLGCFALGPAALEGRWARTLLLLLLLAALAYHSRALFFHRPSLWEFADPVRVLRESPVNRWLRDGAGLGPGDRIAAFPEGGEVYLVSRPAGVGYTYFTPLSAGYLDGEDHRRAAAQMEGSRCALVLLPKEMEAAYRDPASAVGRLLSERFAREGEVSGAVVYRRRDR